MSVYLFLEKEDIVHRRDNDIILVINKVMKKDVNNSIWNIPPVQQKLIDHPCLLHSEITFRRVLLYTNNLYRQR